MALLVDATGDEQQEAENDRYVLHDLWLHL
jgi:hypothetical protein